MPTSGRSHFSGGLQIIRTAVETMFIGKDYRYNRRFPHDVRASSGIDRVHAASG